MSRRCIFCGDTPTSGEHVFGKAWTRSLFPEGTELYEATHTKGFRDSPREVSSWRMRDVDAVVNCACRECNHGWMERLDIRAQPLVTPFAKGESGRLGSMAEIATVSAWAAKIGMCLVTPVLENDGKREEAAHLRETHRVPRGMSIWMGASLAQFPQVWSNQLQLSDRPKLLKGIEGYSSTFKIHGVVLQVAYLPEPIDPGRKAGENWGQHLVQLWPPSYEPVPFPPLGGKQLNEVDLIVLSRSFAIGPFR